MRDSGCCLQWLSLIRLLYIEKERRVSLIERKISVGDVKSPSKEKKAKQFVKLSGGYKKRLTLRSRPSIAETVFWWEVATTGLNGWLSLGWSMASSYTSPHLTSALTSIWLVITESVKEVDWLKISQSKATYAHHCHLLALLQLGCLYLHLQLCRLQPSTR